MGTPCTSFGARLFVLALRPDLFGPGAVEHLDVLHLAAQHPQRRPDRRVRAHHGVGALLVGVPALRVLLGEAGRRGRGELRRLLDHEAGGRAEVLGQQLLDELAAALGGDGGLVEVGGARVGEGHLAGADPEEAAEGEGCAVAGGGPADALHRRAPLVGGGGRGGGRRRERRLRFFELQLGGLGDAVSGRAALGWVLWGEQFFRLRRLRRRGVRRAGLAGGWRRPHRGDRALRGAGAGAARGGGGGSPSWIRWPISCERAAGRSDLRALRGRGRLAAWGRRPGRRRRGAPAWRRAPGWRRRAPAGWP